MAVMSTASDVRARSGLYGQALQIVKPRHGADDIASITPTIGGR